MRVPKIFCLALALAGGLPLLADLKLPSESMPPQRTTLVYGSKIVYYDIGSGPTLVLVHGMAASATLDWAQVIKPLSARYRVIALDQIGYGLSDKPTIDYTVDTWVDFLGEFLRELGVSHAMMAGESLGGWVVAKYAIAANNEAAHLPKVDKLILVDAAGHARVFAARPENPSNFPYSRGPSTFAEYKQGIRSIVFSKTLFSEEYLRHMYMLKLSWRDADTSASLLAGLSNAKKVAAQAVDGHLAEIRVPTLVVWGANDPLIPLADGQDFAKQIPGAKLAVIPECGHVPPVEKVDEFVKAVFGFLGDGSR